MQERSYKVLMYVFLALFIIVAGAGGYFGYKYYIISNKYMCEPKEDNSTVQVTINPEDIKNAITGNIIKIDKDVISLENIIDQKINDYRYDDKTIIEKQVTKEENGNFFFDTESASTDELLSAKIITGYYLDADQNYLTNIIIDQ